MEQGHDLSTSSSGCAEQAARVPGHAQSCLLWGEKAISFFIYPGKTSSGNKEQREVFRSAEGRLGPALKSEQGHRLLPAELQPSVRSLWGGGSSKEGPPVQQPPPRDVPSLLPPHRPGRTGQKSPRRECSQAAAAASALTAPCRGAQGSTRPPGFPGPRCGNQVSPGPPDCPGDPRFSGAPFCGDGLLTPWDCAALHTQVTWDPVLIFFEISWYFSTSVAG